MNRKMPALALAALAASAAPGGALAQTPVKASYDIQLAGLSIGQADLGGTVGGSSYSLNLNGKYSVLLYSGTVTTSASGQVANGRPVPAAYRHVVKTGKTYSTEIGFLGGNARVAEVQPPLPPEFQEGRIPITEEHRKGVMDPLSGLLMQSLRATRSPAETCSGTVPVYAGVSRMDLALSPIGGAKPGEILCKAKYKPVSGYRPANKGVQRFAQNEGIRIAFPAQADGALSLPSRIVVPTAFGAFTAERKQ